MRYSLFVPLLLSLLLGGCRHDHDEVTTYTTTIYYGDVNEDAVVAIDVDTMSLKSVEASNGLYPYEIASAPGSDLYVINRKDHTIGLMESSGNTIYDEIELMFMPRSVAISGEETLVSGVDEPSEAIFTDAGCSERYNDSVFVPPSSYGGSNATGHPYWIDDRYFLLLDRTEKSLELYDKDIFTPVSKINTSSSVHHVLSRDGIYYGILEGEQGVVSPGIVKFTVAEGKIVLLTERLLSDLDGLPTDFLAESWGAHHGALHPDSDHIYIGSAEGNVFVLDLDTLMLTDTFPAGKGVGHFLFYGTVVIVTNHYDTFKSFYDATDPTAHRFLKELSFSDMVYDGVTMQSHTSHIINGYLYFTFNTVAESRLYKVDLSTFEVAGSLVLSGRYLLMGSVISSSTTTDGM